MLRTIDFSDSLHHENMTTAHINVSATLWGYLFL